MSKNSSLKDHMPSADRLALGQLPTYHQNCIDKCGRARPGKTARDKAKGHVPYRINRRVWTGRTAHDKDGRWVKV